MEEDPRDKACIAHAASLGEAVERIKGDQVAA